MMIIYIYFFYKNLGESIAKNKWQKATAACMGGVGGWRVRLHIMEKHKYLLKWLL